MAGEKDAACKGGVLRAGEKGACPRRRGFGPRVFEALAAEKNVGVLGNFVMSRARGARR